MARLAITAVISVALLLSALFSGATFVGTDGGDSSLMHACVTDKGSVRIVHPHDVRASKETPLHWPATSTRFHAVIAREDIAIAQMVTGSFAAIPGLTGSFETTAPGCITALFSLETVVVTGRNVVGRILLDGTPMEGQNPYHTLPSRQ